MKTSSSSKFLSSSSSKKLLRSRSDSSCLHIFMNVTGGNNYILYRIDALEYLYNKPSSTNTRRPYRLRPLLVFPKPVLPENCMCAKLGSSFYFIGGRPWQLSFFGKDSFCKEVYRIRESDLINLVPSQHNTNGGKYLRECTPMNGNKHDPTVFVAENKLYALASSSSTSDTQFEVFDPRRKSWKVLPSQPDGYAGRVTCYVIVEKIVYFKIFEEALLSFHLVDEKWKVLVTHGGPADVFPTHSFASGLPLVVTGGMAFGFVYNADNGTAADDDEDWDDSLTICATPIPHKGNFIRREFMGPSLHLDDKFLDALNSSRCPWVTVKFYEDFSDYMVALDGGKNLCLVSYGSGPVPKDDWKTVDPYTSYVTLSFFQVTPSKHSSCNVGKYGAARSIKAKLLHTAQFIIRTDDLRTCGRIEACFCQGL